MLFNLDLADNELASIARDVLAAAVSDLLRASRLGDHLVVVSRSSCRWLQENLDLSQRENAMLSRLGQDFTQTGDLPRRARVYVSLTHEMQRDLQVNGNAIAVSVRRLVQYRLLERPILLVENIANDGDLFSFLLNNLKDIFGCNYVSFELTHGGGADLPTVFGHRIDEQRIVCGVIDSDRGSPLQANTKLAQMQRIKVDKGWPLSFPSSPPCREAENLVPLTLIMTLPSGFKNSSNDLLLGISRMEDDQALPIDERYCLFFDLKSGLTSAAFGRLNDVNKEWVRNKLLLAKLDPQTSDVAGYGDRVINQIFAENKFQSELRTLVRHQAWRRVFENFFEELIWVFTASPRIAT
jgi:hypothetical protein